MFSFFVLNSNFKSNNSFRNRGSFFKSDNKFKHNYSHYNYTDKPLKSNHNKGSSKGNDKFFYNNLKTSKKYDNKALNYSDKKYFSKYSTHDSKRKYDIYPKRHKNMSYVKFPHKSNWRNRNRNFRPFQKHKPSPNFY